ncbi:SusE domain-containing protein [Flavobacterium sp. XGLA_31]|uniref:SusE domain-containing protein n=1 Tax=Flavobacterium sp. XGLA_31 TaxID=3447666 RepID=UPI003F392FBD
MKNISRFLVGFMGVALAVSCTDDVDKRQPVSTDTAPTLKAPATLSMVLNHDTPDDLATTFVWDYAAYDGTQTVVNYSIEFDEAGNDFASPVTVATTISKYQNFTVGELNSAALNAGFAPFVASNIEVRIKSTVGSLGSLPQYSNSFTITLTPYPAWPNWGIIGDATPTGWGSDTNMDYDLTTHLYSITIHMTAGGGYKFRLDDGWSTNFGDDGNDLSLEANGANIPITVTGDYLIVANFSEVATGGIEPKHYTVTLL